MGVVYVDCEFAESPDFSLTKDPYGLDRLSRTYFGRTDKLDEELKKWPKAKPDATYKNLKLLESQASGRGPFTQIVIQFTGLRDGVIPSPIKAGGCREQTVTLQCLEANQTCEVVYKAPYSSFRYITTKQPQKARFEGVILQTEQSWEMKNLRGDRTTRFHRVNEITSFLGNIVYTKTLPGRFNYARVISSSGPKFQQVGEYWEVVEENEGLIIDVARNDFPRYLEPYFQSTT
jgi:hypothetical protein